MKIMKANFKSCFGVDVTVVFKKGTYLNNGNLYVGAYTVDEYGYFEPYCNVTVNFEEKLEKGMAYVDNNNADNNLLQAMIDMGYMSYMFKNKMNGFCKYPLFCFSDEFLDNIEEL